MEIEEMEFPQVLSMQQCQVYGIPMEEWRPITEDIVQYVQPYYWVSNYGNVFSTWSGGFLYHTQSKTNGGHMNVILSLKTGEIKHAEVHRLVLMAFNYIPGCENLDVNHKDNIPWNNWLWNLEWCTVSYNIKYSYDFGNMPKGQDKFNAILNDDQVHIICKDLELVKPYKEILKDIGYDISSLSNKEFHNLECLIDNIKRKRAWTHISNLYNMPEGVNSLQKFTLDQVHTICKCIVNGMLYRDILIELGYDVSTMDKKTFNNYKSIMSSIKRKKVYKNISDLYF